MSIKKRIVSVLTAGGLLFTCIPVTVFSSNVAVVSADTEDMTVTESTVLENDMTVSGDLTIKDGTFKLNGHKLTVKGNIYHSGGTLDIGTGSVKAGGNYELQAKGGYTGKGELQLYKEESLLEVDGDIIINSNISGSSYQYDGKLIIGGDLRAYSPGDGRGYMPSGSLVTEFKGEKQHNVYFSNSRNYLDLVSVTDGGQLNLTGETSGFTMLSDMTFANGSTIKGDKTLYLNGNTLTVDGDFFQNGDMTVNVKDSAMQVTGNYYQSKGRLDISTGSVKVGGNYELQTKGGYTGSGELQIYKENSYLDVDGDVIINSNIENSSYQYDGKLIIGGGLKVYSPSDGKGYAPSGSHITEFKGSETHEIYFSNFNNGLNKVSSTGTGQIYLTGENTGFTLLSDITFADGTVIKGSKTLDLNGNTLTVDGTFTQNGELVINVKDSAIQVNGNYYQPKGKLDISTGSVKVGGNYELQTKGGYTGSGELQIYKENSVLEVDGDVIINSNIESSSYQYDGKLIIGGGLKVYSPSDGKGYAPSGSHITEFKGSENHEVYFSNFNNNLNKVSSTGTGQLYLTGENSGFDLVSDITLAGGSTLKGSKKLELNGNTLTVDGDFTQNGELTINVNNSVMQITGNYYQPKGKLDISTGAVKVGGNYELQTKGGYAGSGEFLLYKEGSLLDVDGDVIINSNIESSSYQYDGTLSIGGDLKVYNPSGGNGYMPSGSHITEFKGGKEHEAYFNSTQNQTNNIKLGIGDTLKFTGALNGVEKKSGSVTASDSSFAETADNAIKGISEGKTILEFSDGKNSVKKELTVDKTNKSVLTTVSSQPDTSGTTTSTTTVSDVTSETTATAKPEDDFLRGDISRNGKIDLYDAIMIAEYIIGKREFTEEEINIADLNCDGKVNLYDAIGIANYMLTGKLPVIPQAALSNVKWSENSVRFNINYKDTDSAGIFIVPANAVKKNDDVKSVYMCYKPLKELKNGLENTLETHDYAAGDYELRIYNAGKLLCCEQFTIEGKQEILYSNFNISTVENKPRKEVTFTPEKDCRIYSVSTYHWNNGKGLKNPGIIELYDNGKLFGSLNTLGLPGQNGAENVTWIGYPAISQNGADNNIFNGFVMKAGHTYTILDSDADTWSCNIGSDHKGFTEIKGNYIEGSSPAVTNVTSTENTISTTDITVTSELYTASTTVPESASTTVNTTAIGTNGTAPVIKEGNSAAFKTEMRSGLTVSADKNAFEYDGQLKISELDSETASELNEECYAEDLVMLDCWEVDAGLGADEYLPGSYYCEYDLSKLDIPEDMYDRVKIIRCDDNGCVEYYNCELNGNILSWRSSQNSILITVISTLAGSAAFFINKEYGDTIYKSDKKESEHFCFYYNDSESNSAKIKDIEKSEWNKALKETKENLKLDTDVYDNEKMKNYVTNCQALKLQKEYLDNNKDYQTLKKGENIPPEDVKKIIDYSEDAYEYLTKELGADDLNRKITIVCMDYDKMNVWGTRVNPTDLGLGGHRFFKIRKPYIQIRRPKTADKISEAEANNNIILTVTHELFHLFTTHHYPGDDLNCLEFAEMTAMWTESDCIDYYLNKGTIINEKNENNVLIGKNEYDKNSSQQYTLKNSINYRYEDKENAQNKGYSLSRFVSFLNKKNHVQNMNPWTMSLLFNKKYQKSGSVTDLLKDAFELTDKQLEEAWMEYAQQDSDSIVNTMFQYPQKNFMFQKGGQTKQTYDISPVDYSLNGYSVQCRYAKYNWAFMAVSDCEGNYGNLFSDLAVKDDGGTHKFDICKTKKGIVMVQTTNEPSGGKFAEYQGVGVPKGGKFSVYIFMQPDAPKVEFNEKTEKVTVTLPETIKTAAAEDGIIDGYRINFYVDGSQKPISKILTLENADKTYEISASELNIEAGKKAEISVDIQEYIGKEKDFQEFAGPASEKASTNASAKPDEVKEDTYVWVLTDTEVDAGENSSELEHIYSRTYKYTENIDGKITEKTAEVSANICCEKAPPQIIKMGKKVTLDLSIKNLSCIPSEGLPSDLNTYLYGSADFNVRWQTSGEEGDPFNVEPIYMGDTGFYSEDIAGKKQSEVFWKHNGEKYISGTFVCDEFSQAGDYRYINFTSSAGTTRWRYEKKIAKEYEWKLVDTINEPAKDHSDDQNTFTYKISETTENSVKKSVHIFSAKNSAEDMEDETAVFTAKCPVPPQVLKTLETIELDMTMELENNAKVIPWDDTSKVYMQKITDDSAPVYFQSKSGKNYCFCKTVNLDGSKPEQINSASVTATVSAAYEENDKWEIVFESKAGKTRWIYECTGVVDNQE